MAHKLILIISVPSRQRCSGIFCCSSSSAQFDRLVEELLPVLHVHFLRQGVKSSMFCSQWFLTLFSYRYALDYQIIWLDLTRYQDFL